MEMMEEANPFAQEAASPRASSRLQRTLPPSEGTHLTPAHAKSCTQLILPHRQDQRKWLCIASWRDQAGA